MMHDPRVVELHETGGEETPQTVAGKLKASRTMAETRKAQGEAVVLLLAALGTFGAAIAGIQNATVQIIFAVLAAIVAVLFMFRVGLIRRFKREDVKKAVSADREGR